MGKVNPNIIILGLLLIIAVLLLSKSCTNAADTVKGKSDTTIVIYRDSTPPHQPPIIVTTPAINLPADRNTIQYLQPDSKTVIDTIGIAQLRKLYQEEIKKAKELYALCAAEHQYDSTYSFEQGNVRMKATVQGNALQNFQLFPEFQTKIITQTPPPRNSVWLGVDGIYNNSVGAGASVMFQSKRGWAVEAGAAINDNLVQQYRLSYKRRLIK